MLSSKSFLCIDLGAGVFKVASFDVTDAGTLQLGQFGVSSLGKAGTTDADREAAVISGIKKMVSERALSGKMVNVCAPGNAVFSKFVKLPPVDASKVAQIIEYEAKQNVPFPLEEVVWDFQILGTASSGELEVLLVAIKRDVVERQFRISEASGLKLQLLDVSPAALCNAFRYSYGDLEDCSMMLDIGVKTTNVLFFEKGKFFSRSINIGAGSITQEFAAESKLPYEEADRVKIEKGFVSLGGAYEEPDDPQAAAISKIARQVMTRLHIQVDQTMKFYRAQQGGSAPVRVFLAGGASVLPYTAQFFADKLNLPVEYFNPFRNVQIGPQVNVEELEKVAHCYGEVVGLGLRNLAHCPVELNLMPKSSIQKQALRAKQPFFIATIFCILLIVLAYGYLNSRLATVKQAKVQEFQSLAAPLRSLEGQMQGAVRQMDETQKKTAEILSMVDDRGRWPELLAELRQILVNTEIQTRRPTAESGIWIESLGTMSPLSLSQAGRPTAAQPAMSSSECSGESSCESSCCSSSCESAPTPPPSTFAAAVPGAPLTNEVSEIRVRLRAVNMMKEDPSANTTLAFLFVSELKKSQLFDPEHTNLTGTMPQINPADLTFSFDAVLKLKTPIKL